MTTERGPGYPNLVSRPLTIGGDMENPPKCPRCHSEEVLPIAYGMPGPELVEESAAGRVALGGCMVWPEAPDCLCVKCGHDWREDAAGSGPV